LEAIMRWLRIFLASGATALFATACIPASANAATLLIVNPSSIRAGFTVEVRATCGDNVNPAFVHSRAFGSVTLVPANGVLRADVTVPKSTKSGTYTVDLSCASGQLSSAKLTVLDGGKPNNSRGPHTGGGEMAASLTGKVTLYGGLGVLVLGLGSWLLLGVRRRHAVRG
jgi:hypothetical protein